MELIRLVGSTDVDGFFQVGAIFVEHFRKYGGLKPGDHVLEIGCGCGRMAIPLLAYLDATGRYEGLDVHPASIAWAEKTISPAYPHFHFQLADVRNLMYNPSGTIAPEHYRLPYPDASFNFVFLTSVFTHMLPQTQVRYLDEIARVLKVGGRCLATFFLLNEQATHGIRAGRSTFNFHYRWGTCAVEHASHPENVVAYDEATVRRRIAAAGLQLVHPPLPGNWSGRDDWVDFQDMVVFQKERALPLFTRFVRMLRALFTITPPPVFVPARW
jgi:ubiquinone/menaquinone biosynthesis C-methylase UbiE